MQVQHDVNVRTHGIADRRDAGDGPADRGGRCEPSEETDRQDL